MTEQEEEEGGFSTSSGDEVTEEEEDVITTEMVPISIEEEDEEVLKVHDDKTECKIEDENVPSKNDKEEEEQKQEEEDDEDLIVIFSECIKTGVNMNPSELPCVKIAFKIKEKINKNKKSDEQKEESDEEKETTDDDKDVSEKSSDSSHKNEEQEGEKEEQEQESDGEKEEVKTKKGNFVKNICLKVWEKVKEKLITPFTTFNAYRLTFLNIMIITFQLFVEKVILYFSCEKFEEHSVMTSHTDVRCDSSTYRSLMVLFIILAIYCFTLPILIFLFLFVYRKKVMNRDPKFLASFGSLYAGYKNSGGLYVPLWYESYSMFRKILLVFFMSSSLFDVTLSNFFVTVTLFIALGIHVYVTPYRTVTANVLEGMGLLCVIVLQFVKTSTMFEDYASFSIFLIFVTFIPTFSVFTYFKLRKILLFSKLEKPVMTYCVGFCCCRIIWKCCTFCKEKSSKLRKRKNMDDVDDEDDEDEEDTNDGKMEDIDHVDEDNVVVEVQNSD